MNAYDSLAICNACGTQYPETARERCPVCDDPRQFVPPPGQIWTTLAEVRKDRRNEFKQDEVYNNITSIYSEPKFAIGQRCILLETSHGNVLWDLIALIDEETKRFIDSKGGLKAIVISHPHFYTTSAVWAEVFGCPVYIASDDAKWLFNRHKESENLRFLEAVDTSILPGVTAIKCGGHFPGSLCLHWDKVLFNSDTMMTIASSRNPDEYQFEGTVSYSFMWAIPNMIPLDPKTIYQIWSRLKKYDFEATFGNIPNTDVKHKDAKKRLLQSAKIQVRSMGWEGKEEGDLVLQEQLS